MWKASKRKFFFFAILSELKDFPGVNVACVRVFLRCDAPGAPLGGLVTVSPLPWNSDSRPFLKFFPAFLPFCDGKALQLRAPPSHDAHVGNVWPHWGGRQEKKQTRKHKWVLTFQFFPGATREIRQREISRCLEMRKNVGIFFLLRVWDFA